MPTATATTEPAILRCGTLIDGSGREAQHDMALVLAGGRIVSTQPWAGHHEVDATVGSLSDFSGHTVIPGLIDAHAHLCYGSSASTGWRKANADQVGVLGWGLAAAMSALSVGITTVADLGSPHGLALRVANLIDTGLATGPDILAAGAAITTTAGHGSDIGVAADNADELVTAVRNAVADGARIIKVMVTGGAISPASNRRRAQYTEQELRIAIGDAHRLGKRVVGHANATEGIASAVKAGIDIIAHCNWLGPEPGTLLLDPHAIDTMARRKIWIDLNIQGALRQLADTDGTLTGWPYPDPLPSTRWDLLQPLRRAGIPLYVTSDAFGPAIGTFPADLTFLRARTGLCAEELISLVTSEPARALGIDTDRGLIAPGKIADLVVLPGDLRANPALLTQPAAVYRSGEQVLRDGRFAPPAASRAFARESGAQHHLLREVFEDLA